MRTSGRFRQTSGGPSSRPEGELFLSVLFVQAGTGISVSEQRVLLQTSPSLQAQNLQIRRDSDKRRRSGRVCSAVHGDGVESETHRENCRDGEGCARASARSDLIEAKARGRYRGQGG